MTWEDRLRTIAKFGVTKRRDLPDGHCNRLVCIFTFREHDNPVSFVLQEFFILPPGEQPSILWVFSPVGEAPIPLGIHWHRRQGNINHDIKVCDCCLPYTND